MSDVEQEILAEPFPGTVAQGLVLVIAKEFRRLLGMVPTGILGASGRREWVASIYAAVKRSKRCASRAVEKLLLYIAVREGECGLRLAYTSGRSRRLLQIGAEFLSRHRLREQIALREVAFQTP